MESRNNTIESTILFSEDNLALLDVRFKQYRVGDGIEAYIVDNRVYVPLVDMFALLELNISTTADGAAGWFINDNYDFSLKQSDSGWLATVIGMSVEVPNGEILQHYDMLYADIQLLEDWFGARFSLNFSQSLLALTTQQTLPFEARITRGERVINKRHLPRLAENPLLDNPYKLIEMPSLNINATHLTQRNDKTDQATQTRTTYSVISHGDLGYMNSEVFVSGDRKNGLFSATTRFERYDNNGLLLGPLGATHIGVGDITSPTIALASGGGSGRGFVMDNKDLSVNQKSDIRIIEGDYHPGWDIELYQNGIVVGYQTIGADGHYEFTDIPLFLGNNRFILKFYGPGGKEETEERSLFLGANEEDVGKLKYSASLFQPSLKSIDLNGVNDAREIYEQAVFNAQYGINANTSLHSGLLHKNNGLLEEHSFYNIGLQSSLWNTNLLFDITRDNEGNTSYAYSANTFVQRTNFKLGVIEYGPTLSEINPRLRQIVLGASGRLFETPYNLSGRRVIRKDTTEDTYNLGLSGNLDRLNWSNNLNYSDLNTRGNGVEELDGNLYLGYSLSPMNFRLGLNYHIDPTTEIDSANVSTSFAIDHNTSVNLSARYQPEGNRTRYNLGLTWKLPYFQLTPSVSYSDNGEILGLVTVSASLGKRSSSQGLYYNLNSANHANKGTFKARLFDDVNNNGYYEKDEPLLEGGEISALQSSRKGRSDQEGIAWLERVSAWQQTDIAYEPGSITAAPMIYSGKPFSVVMRPGSITAVNMPFVRTGEIDGTVYRQIDTGTKLARGVRLALCDLDGNVLRHTSTDAYGFYLFENLKPGDYRLQAVDESWLKPKQATFTITSLGDAVLDKNLTLKSRPFTLSARTATRPQAPIDLKSAADNPNALAPTAEPTLQPHKVLPQRNAWSLQVASFRTGENAETLTSRLAAMGYTTFTRKVTVNGFEYTRVYAGDTPQKALLKKAKEIIDHAINVISIPTRLHIGE